MEMMIASAESVREALAPLTLKQLDLLAELSGVPVSTIYKIKLGTTVNPGVETVRLFMPHIERVRCGSRHDVDPVAAEGPEAVSAEQATPTGPAATPSESRPAPG